jgi:type IV secretion system protein VirB10
VNFNPVAGPKTPAGHSSIRNISFVKHIVPVGLIGAALFTYLHPLNLAAKHDDSIAPAKVSTISSADLVATPRVTPNIPAPKPTLPPPQPQQIGSTDIAATTPPVPPSPPAQQVPTMPPTIPPAVIAAQQRAEAQRAALDGPIVVSLVSPMPKPAQSRQESREVVYWLRRGMIISATLSTPINSEIPGLIVAYLDEDVFDFSHRVIIAPYHAKLIGSFGGSGTSYSQTQTRIPVSFDTIQVSPTQTIDLRAQPGVDPTGTSGLGAVVNHHTGAALANFLLLTAAGVLLSRGGNQQCSGVNCAQSYGSSSAGGSVIQAGQQMFGQRSQPQPTLFVSEGAKVSLMVQNDMEVPQWQQ